MYIAAIFNDYSSCHSAFSEGISSLESRDIDRAAECFSHALASVNEKHPNYRRYVSYYGMARVFQGQHDGIQYCRAAITDDIREDEIRDGDLYLNLARVEWFLKNRRNAVLALQSGLKQDQRHEGLSLMWSRIGERKRKPVFFLPRGNVVNKLVGCLLRRRG
jgi:tetratricopeptide (TPR) repeat protein